MHTQILIRLVILGLAALSACSPASAIEDTATSQPALTSDPIEHAPASPTDTHQPIPSPTQTNLDLREANVVGVEFDDLGGGRYRFDVTLLHDDDGEAPSYADWWQVETEDGQVLGRRVLTHSHGNQPFTRSTTIDVPADITLVIVRGHDMLHEYGGQAMRVNLETGESAAVMNDAP